MKRTKNMKPFPIHFQKMEKEFWSILWRMEFIFSVIVLLSLRWKKEEEKKMKTLSSEESLSEDEEISESEENASPKQKAFLIEI